MKRGLIVAVVCVLAIMEAAVSYAGPAQDILEVSGVKGGLVVHLGCGDGRLTAALHANDSYLVQGLDTDAENVEKARAHILSLGLYGKVSSDRLTGTRLPYADNTVNLVVAHRSEHRVQGKEIIRILAPNGVAMVQGEWGPLTPRSSTEHAGWTKFVKPRPVEIDEWTHYLHGPDGNQVAADTVVGPPERVKWLAKPYWGRDHRHGNQTAMVSARGRLFYVGNDVKPSVDLLPDRPHLIARDAFNGVLLWKRPMYPMVLPDMMSPDDDPDQYHLHEPEFPMELKVVAVDDRLYTAFGKNGEVQVLDAATGDIVQVYKGTEETEEILYSDGILLTVTGADSDEISRRRFSMADLNDARFERKRGRILRAIHAESGRNMWKYNSTTDGGLNVSPVVKGDRIFTIVGENLTCLELQTGQIIWRTPVFPGDEETVKKDRSIVYIKGPAIYDHLIATADVLLFVYKSKNTNLHAFSAHSGTPLWQYACRSPQRSGAQAFVVGNDVWVHAADGSNKPLVALDLKTGTERKRVDATKTFDVGHHHRCYGNRATDRFVLIGRRGVEFIDFESGENKLHHWVRGKCRFGVLPCNGLLYSLPHNCSCYPFSTFKGYSALAAGSPPPPVRDMHTRLEKGPAYGSVSSADPGPGTADWPTYRHDIARSGSTSCMVDPKRLKLAWRTPFGTRTSAMTASGGRLFVCTPDDHRVHALDKKNGKRLWSFTAGGKIDSPPTIYKGLALFGSADGYVYCLRVSDGRLVWRFLAAPVDMKIFAYGQLESVWPVHGAVLVNDEKVYLTAGRSSLLDGGIAVYALDPATGRVLSSNTIYKTYADAEPAMLQDDGHENYGELAVLQDILVGDDTNLYLKQLKLDENCVVQGKSDKLISGEGILNAAWFSRIGWYFGAAVESRRSNADLGKYDIMDSPRQGQYLVFDDQKVYSVRLYPNVGKFDQSFVPGGDGYRVFADEHGSPDNKWNIFVPVRVEAMAATGGATLYMAGSPDTVDRADPWSAIEGRKGGVLWAVSAKNGQKTAEYGLDAPPVFDGLIAAENNLFMSLADGTVICMQEK